MENKNNGMVQTVKFLSPEEKAHRENNGAMNTIQFSPEKKSPEERRYLVLLTYLEGTGHDNDMHSYILATGRSDTYFAIKELLLDIDMEESIVILEGKRALVEGEYITVSAFLRHIRDNELVEDETGYIIDEVLVEEE